MSISSFTKKEGGFVITISQLTKIAKGISRKNSEYNFELLCGLADAYDMGKIAAMDKRELVEFLSDNLTLEVEVTEELGIQNLCVKLILCNKVISTSDVELPYTQ